MADTIFNKNELILDRVRNVSFSDLYTKKLLLRLTSVEDPSLGCTAEGEEIVDAIGSLITTLYRAKKATFSGSNSLVSLDLAAAQYGSKKEIAGVDGVASVPTRAYEIIDIAKGTKLAHEPVDGSIKWIYTIDKGEIGTAYAVGSAASDDTAVVATDGTITLPTGVTEGSIYVEYIYESKDAVKVVNKASEFPKAGSLVIHAYFRDKCTEELYSGAIICPKAKLNPESVELALTSTGKHPFEFTMMKDYCDDVNDELFSIVISK